MTLIDTAKHYKSKGLSIIPVDIRKRPRYKWYTFSERIATDSEIEDMFADAKGLGIVCGKISCPKEDYSLLVIDIDCKYFDEHITFQQVKDSIPQELLKKLFVVRTQSGGYHFYFYTPVLEGGNQKYAMRYTTEEERVDNPDEKVLVLIENRHNGGFVCAPPTEGYEVVSNVKKIPYITLEEHNTIVESMNSFNRVFNNSEAAEKIKEERRNKYLISPFQDYNENCDLLGLLVDNGYTIVGNSDAAEVKLKRPGNSNSVSSGFYSAEGNRWVNFSTSGLFESGKGYSACEVLNILECGGDWKICYKRLLDEGYGIGIDMSSEVKKLVSMHKKGDLDGLLKYVFEAEKVKEGIYKINNQIIEV